MTATPDPNRVYQPQGTDVWLPLHQAVELGRCYLCHQPAPVPPRYGYGLAVPWCGKCGRKVEKKDGDGD